MTRKKGSTWGASAAGLFFFGTLAGCGGADSQTPGDEVIDVGDSGNDGVSGDVFALDADPETEFLFDTAPDTKRRDTGEVLDGALDTADDVSDTGVDTAVLDSGSDTDPTADVGTDTAAGDTSSSDTGLTDSGVDTGATDTGSTDTGTGDTGPADTGPADTGPADTGPADTGPGPTVKVILPAENTSIAFTNADVCQSKLFGVSYTAPAGLKSLQFKFITPDGTKSGVGMTGTCNGAAAYGYFVDPVKYSGGTSGTFHEDVSVAGLYSGTGGAGRWWWCTPPGGSTAGTPTAFVNAAPAPGAAGVQTLSNYCYAKTTRPAGADPLGSWKLQVILIDNAGNTVTDTLHFWIYR